LQASSPTEQAAFARKRLTGMRRSLELAMAGTLRNAQSQYAAMLRQLDALSPLKVMGRGYSLVYDEREQKLIRSIEEVQPGDLVRVRLVDGRLDCQVWGIRGEEQTNG
jgi:exodeoxyribonuclease VII large subunit